MNEERIENLLRKAPPVAAPAGLRERLQRAVRLTGATRSEQESGHFETPFWLRRWLPAMSFAVFFLGCLVVIGVQSNVLSNLRHENEGLRASSANLAQLRTDNEEYQRLLAQSRDLERLRKDNAELLALREETAKLRAQVQEADKLRAENQKLVAENAAAMAARSGTNSDFFAKAKASAERSQCVNNLKQLGLSFRVWATDNNDQFPTDFISMTNELNNFMILQCPSDSAHAIKGWADVSAFKVSYPLLVPGIADTENPATVASYCPYHHNYLMLDGSVQMLDAEGEKLLKRINGRLVLEKRFW